MKKMKPLKSRKSGSKNKEFDVQIIIVSGMNHIEKAILGFATALSCSYSGSKTVVFLAMQGAAFANPEEGKIAYIKNFDSVQKYIDMLLEAKVRIEACTTCVDNFCLTKEQANGRKKIRKGIIYAGLSTAAIRCTNTKTVVF